MRMLKQSGNTQWRGIHEAFQPPVGNRPPEFHSRVLRVLAIRSQHSCVGSAADQISRSSTFSLGPNVPWNPLSTGIGAHSVLFGCRGHWRRSLFRMPTHQSAFSNLEICRFNYKLVTDPRQKRLLPRKIREDEIHTNRTLRLVNGLAAREQFGFRSWKRRFRNIRNCPRQPPRFGQR